MQLGHDGGQVLQQRPGCVARGLPREAREEGAQMHEFGSNHAAVLAQRLG